MKVIDNCCVRATYQSYLAEIYWHWNGCCCWSRLIEVSFQTGGTFRTITQPEAVDHQ